MKHWIKRAAAFILAGITVLSCYSPVYAYDETDYDYSYNEETGETWYMVDNGIHENATVRMKFYVFVDPEDVDYTSYKSYYTFNYYTGVDEGEDPVHLCKEFMIMGHDPAATLEHGEVYCFQVGLEPGEYCFSSPDAVDNNTIRVLTREFKSPMVGEGSYTQEDLDNGVRELVTVEDEGFVCVFAYFGSEEWINDMDVLNEYINWAKQIDEDWQMSFDLYASGYDEAVRESAFVDMISEEQEEEEDPFIPSAGPTRIVTSENHILEAVAEEEEKGLSPILIVGLGILATMICGIGFWIKKRNSF